MYIDQLNVVLIRNKFRLGKSRTDKPELMLIAAQNWIPLRIIIEGKARRMTVMYHYKGEYNYSPIRIANDSF